MSFIDSHSHLSFLSTHEGEEIITGAPDELSWVLGGYQPSEWEAQLALKQKFPERIKTCYGLHPWFVRSEEFNLSLDLEALKIWSDQADFIGEVGLDFFGDPQVLKKKCRSMFLKDNLKPLRKNLLFFTSYKLMEKLLRF